MEVEKKLEKEILEYCKLNDIQDVTLFLKKIIKKGFDLEKWGDLNEKTRIRSSKAIDENENVPEKTENAPEIIEKTENAPEPKQKPKEQYHDMIDLGTILTHRDVESNDIYDEE